MGKIPFRRFGAMIDLSRNAVMSVDGLKRFAATISEMGYNTLLLYMEDVYTLPGEEYFGYLRGRYSEEELKDVVSYCETIGMEVIPCIQTLAHLDAIMPWPKYAKICDFANILLAGADETYELVEKMFQFCRRVFKTDTVNIGMDEAHMIGLGKYLDQNGFENRFDILSRHLNRVQEIARRYNYKTVMWSDMFFRLSNHGVYSTDTPCVTADLEEKIPKDVSLCYWEYYSADPKRYRKMLAAHKLLGRELWFAGGSWTWMGFAPHNRFSILSTKAAIQQCREAGIENVFLTLWGDNGGECSRFAVLPALFHAAMFAAGETKTENVRRAFREKYGIGFEAFCDLDLFGPKVGKTAECVKNPDKYLLYNDYFCGMCDSTLTGKEGEAYAHYSRALSRNCNDPAFGVLFRRGKTLCDVLKIKADLGQRTRRAYESGDREEMKKVIASYREIEKKLPLFIRAHREAWFAENKPFGFDVQEIRLGGLLLRTKSCRERLEKYLADGEKIPELEEKLLDFAGGGEEFAKEPRRISTYKRAVTPHVL